MDSTTILPVKPPRKFDFETRRTASGEWKIYIYPDGRIFREYRSDVEIGDRPLVSIVRGTDPRTGRMGHARGVVAIGQRATGFIAIGQFCNGYLSLGQFVTARIAAIGQFAVAPVTLSQFSLSIACVAQLGVTGWGIMQAGAVVFAGFGMEITNIGDQIMPWLNGLLGG